MSVELGGNIVLDGFEGRDFTEMIVVKKMVGQYARRLSDRFGPGMRLRVALADDAPARSAITSSLRVDAREFSADASATNLYMALDASLKELISHAQG